jgi:hypothetical protein
MIHIDALIDRLNQVSWRQRSEITPAAEVLIHAHLEAIRIAISFLIETQHLTPVEAHGRAQSAGSDSPAYEDAVEKLFHNVSFRGADTYESIIASVGACYGWEFDLELIGLVNPWLPLIDLYLMGYTTSGEDSPDDQSVTLIIGYRDAEQHYIVV